MPEEIKTTEPEIKPEKKSPRRPIVILLILLIIAVALCVQYFLTQRHPESYISPRFQVYAQVPSLKTVYREWINLEAADIVLSSPNFQAIRKMLIDFRAQSLSRNILFQGLLDVRADIIIGENYQTLAIFDLGWRSLFTRLMPIVGPNLNLNNITIIRKKGQVLFQAQVATNSVLYFSFKDNLLLLSPSQAVLDRAFERADNGDNLFKKGDQELLRKMANSRSSTLKFLVDTDMLLRENIGRLDNGAALLNNLTFPRQSLFAVKIDNQTINLELSAAIDSPKDGISKILKHSPQEMGALSFLPDDTALISSINLGNFKDLYHLTLDFSGEKVEQIYKKAEEASMLLLGMGLDELVFDWIGSEVGVVQTASAHEPLFYCKIKSRDLFHKSMDKISASVLLDGDSSIVLDSVRLNRIKLPDFLNGVLESFQLHVPSPYYIELGNYLFLSLDAENLARLVSTYKAGKTLPKLEAYKKISGANTLRASLLLYYQLDQYTPFFLTSNSILSEILSLYGRGFMTLSPDNGLWTVKLSAHKLEKTTIKNFPGFPLKASGNITSPVIPMVFPGSSVPWLVYTQNSKDLIIQDLSATEKYIAAMEDDSTLLEPLSDDEKTIMGYSSGGSFYRFDKKGQQIPPFPLTTTCRASFTPVPLNDKYAVYSRDEKKVLLIDKSGSVDTFPFEPPSTLVSPPAYRNGRWAFYPKSFDNQIILTDPSGQVITGWPVSTDGICYGSPLFARKGELTGVFIQTQSGKLFGWDLFGKPISGFPLELQGVFYQQPTVYPISAMDEDALLTLAEDGSLRLIGLDGKVMLERKLGDCNGKEAKILLADLNKDGRKEIVIYQNKNSIMALDQHLSDLPGFPVKGNTSPQFTDLNRDGKLEMITAGVDNTIYAYTLDF